MIADATRMAADASLRRWKYSRQWIRERDPHRVGKGSAAIGVASAIIGVSQDFSPRGHAASSYEGGAW